MIDSRGSDVTIDNTNLTLRAIRSFGGPVCKTGQVTHRPLGLFCVGCVVA
jgi:hypothetical protein